MSEHEHMMIAQSAKTCYLCGKTEREIKSEKELNELRAQVAIMYDALKTIDHFTEIPIGKAALNIKPPEAYKRVNRLVEALNKIDQKVIVGGILLTEHGKQLLLLKEIAHRALGEWG